MRPAIDVDDSADAGSAPSLRREPGETAEHARALRRRWPVALAALAAALGIAAAATVVQPRAYEASARLFVGRQAITRPDLPLANELTLASLALVKSYSEAIRSRPIAEDVRARLGIGESADDLLERLRAAPVEDTQVIRVTFRDADPKVAAQVANAFAQSFIVGIKRIDPQQADDLGVQLAVLEPAAVPDTPSSPQPLRMMLAGLLVGLVAAWGAATAAERLSSGVSGPRHAQRVSGMPVLGRVPLIGDGSQPLPEAAGPAAEALKLLRTALRFRTPAGPGDGAQGGPRVVAVTSAEPGEGKTTVAYNLAAAFADAGAATVLLEADLRRPVLAAHLALHDDAGLGPYLSAGSGRLLQRTVRPTLFVAPAGAAQPNPSELLGSQTMAGLVARLRTEAGVVIVDTPPVLAVSDAASMSPFVDAFVVVVRLGTTREQALREAVRTLREVGAPLLGLVLVGGEPPQSYGYV